MPDENSNGLDLSSFDVKGDKFVAPDVGVPGPSPRGGQLRESVAQDDSTKRSASTNTASTGTDTKLAQTLEALNNKLTVESQNARLITDPNVRAYLAAREAGKKVKLVAEDDLAQRNDVSADRPAAVISPPNLETMTNAQLAEYLQQSTVSSLAGEFKRQIKEQMDTLRSEFSPVLDSLVQSTNSQHSKEINSQIKAVRDKYEDFEQLRPKMAEISNTTQGVTAEELYILAKIRSGLPLIPQEKTETERPSSIPTERTNNRRAQATGGEVLRGRRGFDQLLTSALNGKED